MSVFLRWGLLGIFGVAALMYAYNASKRLAAADAYEAPPRIPEIRPTDPLQDEAGLPPVNAPPPELEVSEYCKVELAVAQRAVEFKQEGAPLDRVMRMQEIAFEQAPSRRKRLEKIATRWYGYEPQLPAETLRENVLRHCRQYDPVP